MQSGTLYGGVLSFGRTVSVSDMNLRDSIFGMKVKVKDSHIDAGLSGGTAFSGCAIANYQCKVGCMRVKNTTVLGGECGIFSVNSLKLKNSEVRGS